MEFLLLVIIGLLTYIAFFTPERRESRKLKKLNKLFNTSSKTIEEFADTVVTATNKITEEEVLRQEEENLDKVVKEQTAIDLANGIPPYKTEGELWNAIFRGEPRNEAHLQARITLLKDLEEQNK